MSVEVKTHTALHVLKGAVQKVLGAEWTAGVYVKANHGRLTVKFHRKPTAEELAGVEEEANRKIMEDAPVEELDMERVEAERRWGDTIYDLFPLPASVTRLRVLHIPDWNVNACREVHTNTTGDIGSIFITKTRFRPSKQVLEISFTISQP